MKGCERCITQIRNGVPIQVKREMDMYGIAEIVPESECEFWAHAQLRATMRVAQNMARTIGLEGVPDE